MPEKQFNGRVWVPAFVSILEEETDHHPTPPFAAEVAGEQDQMPMPIISSKIGAIGDPMCHVVHKPLEQLTGTRNPTTGFLREQGCCLEHFLTGCAVCRSPGVVLASDHFSQKRS